MLCRAVLDRTLRQRVDGFPPIESYWVLVLAMAATAVGEQTQRLSCQCRQRGKDT